MAAGQELASQAPAPEQPRGGLIPAIHIPNTRWYRGLQQWAGTQLARLESVANRMGQDADRRLRNMEASFEAELAAEAQRRNNS